MNQVAVSYQASAPGSLMLMGEYAVLQGGIALCGAIDKRIYVTLKPRQDQIVTIQSTLGNYQTTIAELTASPPFEFVLQSLITADIAQGCDLVIRSDFSHEMGLGSSAAVTAATLHAIAQWQGNPIDETVLLNAGIHVIRHVQGKGSGADIAASIYGGIVIYQNDVVLDKVENLPLITVIFTGSKTKTANAIRLMNERFKNNAAALHQLYDELGELAKLSIPLFKVQDVKALGALFNRAQVSMNQLGVNTRAIDSALHALGRDPAILGAKISGSGLGDCVIGLGKANQPQKAALAIQLHHLGLNIEAG